MTRLFPARRSAERFDSLVESGRRDDVDRTTTDLLELVGALRSVPQAPVRPEFVSDLRERLLLAAETELTPVAARRRDEVARLTIKPSRTRRERRVGIVLGAAALLGATTSMAVASQSAIPGDALYPVKRAIENTQTGFSVGEDAKGETILGNASGRLDEVDKLTHRSNPDAQLVTETLNTFTDQATQAADHLMSDYEQNGHQHSIQQLHVFAEQSMNSLSDLEGAVPPAAHDALLNAAQSVFAIDAAAANVCPDPACGDDLTEVPGQLVAGATEALGDGTGALAGGELAGTDASGGDPTGSTQPQPLQGGKGNGRPSGMNPPETPIDIPTATSDATSDVTSDATSDLTSDATTGLGNLLPGGGTHTATVGGGTGGKGGKHHHHVDGDVAPVTDTVNQVVTGVVEGVNGLLSGLTGN
jgi:hypothetical protein